METFTWGIIGPGNIATTFAADLALANNAHHRVGAVLSHDLAEAADFAVKENAPQYYNNIDDFLREATVNAAYIATPHPLHYEETLLCLQHRIPVLCEKPLAMNKAQVQEMVNAAVQHHTFLLEGMWIRFLPSIRTILSLVEQDVIGKLISVRADMSYKAPADPESRYFNPALGGGSLLDLGIYPVFLSHLLMGKPDNVYAYAKLSDKGIDESCILLFHYKDGSYALLESSLIIQTEQVAAIYGDKGKLLVQKPWNEKPAGIIQEMYDGTTIVHPCEWEGRGMYYEAEEVYDCVKQGKLSSEQYCHAFSLDLMDTLDTVRKQTHIVYPFEKQ